MAKAKKTKPREQIRWRVSLDETPAKYVGSTYAPDAQTAEKQVAEEYEISGTLRHKLIAIRDEL